MIISYVDAAIDHVADVVGAASEFAVHGGLDQIVLGLIHFLHDTGQHNITVVWEAHIAVRINPDAVAAAFARQGKGGNADYAADTHDNVRAFVVQGGSGLLGLGQIAEVASEGAFAGLVIPPQQDDF